MNIIERLKTDRKFLLLVIGLIFATWLLAVPILLIPISVFFIWKYTDWNREVKWSITIVCVLIIVWLLYTYNTNSTSQNTQYNTQTITNNSKSVDSPANTTAPTINNQSIKAPSRQKYLETIGYYEGEILDVFKNEINSDIFTELGNHEIALRIKSGRDKLINIKVKTIATDLPSGTEIAHKHFNNAIDLYIEAARKFQEGIFKCAYFKRSIGN